ncbi:AraC family transcriptional regulator [Streptomyces sp. NPDC012888]|uniref:AraC family transcriptional regulator n=1 Tax=Streptomyces sp. NPDC012888 TaxID=3364855 RepID=UPI0036B224B6
MDVVSDAISAVRTGRPASNRVRVGGSWCTRLAPYEGAGFHVVLAGGCWLLPDGGEPVALGPGDAVLLPHGTGHVIADSVADAATVAGAVPFESWQRGREPGPPPVPAGRAGATEMLCGKYRFDRSRQHPLMAELPALVHLPHRVGGHPELRSAIDLLGRELDEGRPGSSIAVPSLLDLLLVYMIRSWMHEAGTAAAAASGTGPGPRPRPGTGTPSRTGTGSWVWPAVLGDPVVAAAVRAVHAEPAAPWTNDRLAAEAGVSRPTLARRFTALVGRPPMAYLTWWRLTLAAGLLRDTPDPLAAIARRVGYGTPYALSHAFSREFGTTPGRYRAAATAPGG